MFDTPADARKRLAARLQPPALDVVVASLQPTIQLSTIPGEASLGASRLGGAPDGAKGAEWPRPPSPPSVEEIVSRAAPSIGDEMRKHFEARLPYPFIAQIDLAEAARLGPVAADLPGEGRLLFFYDGAVGPWETGVRPALVLWDRTPLDALARLEQPKDLTDAQARERAAFDAVMADSPKVAGYPEVEGTVYGAPPRAVRLSATLALPDFSAQEAEAIRSLDDFDELHEELSLEAAKAGRQQLLGAPQPEQDDPRYDAVVVTEHGVQHLPREEWKAKREQILDHARDWRLLFQLDVFEWMQRRYGEGTVYFVIRKSDLRERRFENVVAVYQQT